MSGKIAAALLSDDERVWVMRPSAMRALLATTDAELEARSALPAIVPSTPPRRDKVATIRIAGPITRWPQTGLLALLFGGGTSVEEVRLGLRAALSDPDVERIVLDVDSPGGSVDGLTELAREIYEARGKKEIVAWVDTMAASGAFWVAAQASRVLVTPSGSIGSVGVYALHLAHDRELDMAGVTPTFVTSSGSPYKTEANPLEPLGDEARAEVQRRVDEVYAVMTRDIARGRGVGVDVVRETFGRGRMVLAAEAVKRNMADEVATRSRAYTIARGATAGAQGSIDDDVKLAAAAAVAAAVSAEAVIASDVISEAPLRYIEVRDASVSTGYRDAARDAYWSAVLDHNATDRAPSMHFFRRETADDEWDTWSRRISDHEAIAGRAYPDANEIWITTEHASLEALKNTVRHEVRHCMQPDETRAERERDSHEYAHTERDFLTELLRRD